MTDEMLWIVYAGKEPTTAHLSLDDAKRAAQWSIARGHSDEPYSIWTARLTHSMGVGIPIHATRDATNDVLDLAIKPDATGKFEGD